MFRALYAHHQEVEIYWDSISYRPLSGSPWCPYYSHQCGATDRNWGGCKWVSRRARKRTIPDSASIKFSLLMMSI